MASLLFICFGFLGKAKDTVGQEINEQGVQVREEEDRTPLIKLLRTEVRKSMNRGLRQG